MNERLLFSRFCRFLAGLLLMNAIALAAFFGLLVVLVVRNVTEWQVVAQVIGGLIGGSIPALGINYWVMRQVKKGAD